MAYDDITIKYHGFHPSPEAKDYMESIIQEIRDEAPYGSHVKATISRKDHNFKGIIQINSFAGPFFTVASGDGLKDIAPRLLQQMRRRLDKWKSKRFEQETLKQVYEEYSNSSVA